MAEQCTKQDWVGDIKEKNMKTFTEIENGFYRDENGDLYHDETIGRYRVAQRIELPNKGWQNWTLFASSSSLKVANEVMQKENEECIGMAWEGYVEFKVFDFGGEITVKRLAY